MTNISVEDSLRKGLTSTPKFIPFWFLYDKEGSEIFGKAWRHNDYHYMNKSEISLIKDYVEKILNQVQTPIKLVDIGCGNCDKTRLFIDAILKRQDRLDFVPVDIDGEFLLETSKKLMEDYNSKLDVHPSVADWTDGIKQLSQIDGDKLVLWFGGLLNLTYPKQVQMLKSLSQSISGNKDMHESLDEFKFRPDTTTNTRVICPCASEILMYYVVTTLAPSFFIGSSSYLQAKISGERLQDHLSSGCICENKDADQLRGDREADQRFYFHNTDSTIPLFSAQVQYWGHKETDKFVLSMDVTQDPEKIKQAYLDPTGYMAPYYRNALHRLKRDYQSTVDINKLQIDVAYTQRKGPNTCSYLTALARAKEEMTFDIPGLGMSVHLEKDECINIADTGAESTCKYTEEQIQSLMEAGQLTLDKIWVHDNKHTALCLIAKKTSP